MDCECGMGCPPCESCSAPECECQCFEIDLENEPGPEEDESKW